MNVGIVIGGVPPRIFVLEPCLCCDRIDQLCNRDKQKRKEDTDLRGSPTLRWLRPRAEMKNIYYSECFSDYRVIRPAANYNGFKAY